MFGGYGIYCDGVMAALIADEQLYLKVDDENRADFEAAGMSPFTDWKGDRPMQMSYYELPATVFADVEQLAVWLTKAIAAARAAESVGYNKPRG
ncbi:MAG: TfoX/Sxy family protein [Spirulinaceae cyanobacterium SM2_1_0]|nr:TfoX/Sxy family protein [Spirulinaceae cyanobacterium SM2_1_0]